MLPKICQSCAVVDRGAQHANSDLNKFGVQGLSPSVSNTKWVDLLQCIYQLVEFEDLRWVEHSACLEAVEESLSRQ